MKTVKGNYYSGGFAEIVSNPSDITYSYLKEWFNGKSSLGKAMKILSLPYQEINVPILELIDGELLVNLQNEEKTLYKNTIFKYMQQKNFDDTPKLMIDKFKLVNPVNLINTFNILIKQSIWISNPQKVLNFAKDLVKNMPESTEENKTSIEQILRNDIWPPVIVLGVLSEFFNQLIKQDSGINFSAIHSYISNKQSLQDWFFLSIAEQKRVKDKKLSFEHYIEKYGKRADKDYELISPRWYEMKDTVKKRINGLRGNFSANSVDENLYSILKKNLQSYIDTLIELQILRSEAKRKILLGVDVLRRKLKPRNEIKLEPVNRFASFSNSQGQAVSKGVAEGIVKHITSNDQLISEDCIGIFPNASPEFSVQYPKCKGIIFLKGGQTSHGSIVAREFGIPALIASSANKLQDGIFVTINGTEGTWVVGKLK